MSDSILDPMPQPLSAASGDATQRIAVEPHSPWPRLIAHVSKGSVGLAIERKDRRLTLARQVAASCETSLGTALTRYLAEAGQPISHGVLVTDGKVGAGMFSLLANPLGISVERLRLVLGLQTLRVIDEDAAIGFSAKRIPEGDVSWILPPSRTIPQTSHSATVCKLGTPANAAVLLSADSAEASRDASLMRYPFAPQDDDERIVQVYMQSQGVRPILANVLSTAALSLAYRAINVHEGLEDLPVSAEEIVSLARHDPVAQRACNVVCGAVISLCGLLSLNSARVVYLAGYAAELLHTELRRYPATARLAVIHDDRPNGLSDVAIGMLPTEARYLMGATEALDMAVQAMVRQASGSVCENVRAAYGTLTKTEKRVADLVLSEPEFSASAPISVIAKTCGVSEPQVIRFCRSLGFSGLTDFKLTMVASMARSKDTDQSEHSLISHSNSRKTPHQTLAKVVYGIARMREQIDLAHISQAVALLVHARRINLCADADHNHTAELAVRRLWRLGLPTMMVSAAELREIRRAELPTQTVCIFLTSASSDAEIANLTATVIRQGAEVIVLTDQTLSELPDRVVQIATGFDRTAFSDGFVPSNLLALLMIHVLLQEVEQKMSEAAAPKQRKR